MPKKQNIMKENGGFVSAWTKQSFPVLFLGVVVLFGVAVWAGVQMRQGENLSPFSVVSMTNGDIYFGRLSWFPQPHLSGAWVLQRYTDDKGQQQLAVSPITKALWAPADTIYLSRDNMLSWARLRTDSSLAAAFYNPNSVPLSGSQEQSPASSQGDQSNTSGKK